MGNLLTVRVGNILTKLLGNVLTAGVGKVLDIYRSSVKYEKVYPNGFQTVPASEAAL